MKACNTRVRAFPAARAGRLLPTRNATAVPAPAAAAANPAIDQSTQGKASSAQDFSYTLPGVDKTVLGVILGGGAGTRLYPLTKKRAKPAVPLGANYRLIDIPVSNCLNSNINKIYCLTQFNSASLNRHLTSAYNANVGTFTSRGFVEVLAATQTPQKQTWFQGTADAVRQYMWLFEQSVADGVEDFLILSGDHLYRCNYQDFVREHRESGSDITVAALPCDPERASAFGLMKINDQGRITSFAEKPTGDALKAMEVDTTVLGLDADKAQVMPHIASMGIYVVKADAMRKLLMEAYPNANDFGSEVIPGAVSQGMRVQAYLYEGYWEDIGTIGAFYNSQLALLNGTPPFSFYDKSAPIYTMSRFLPPSKFSDAVIESSMIGDGCYIQPGVKVVNSVVGLRAKIYTNSIIEESLLMGTDYYERPEDCELTESCLPMGIGANSHLRKCIVDKNARIGQNVKLINKEGVTEAIREDDGFIVKDGIIVVIKDAAIPSGFEF